MQIVNLSPLVLGAVVAFSAFDVPAFAAHLPPEIQCWQMPCGARATGYLGGASVAVLRSSVAGQAPFRQRDAVAVLSSDRSSTAPPEALATQQQSSPPATAEQENLFWQSIVNSTDPADFEAYLEVFPNGVFRRLAENRLAALRSPGGNPPASAGRPAGGVRAPASGSRVSSDRGALFGGGAGVDAPRLSGDVFRDCPECPEMVVLPGGGLAMGRYEVTVGEYRAFASATGGTGDDSWRDHDSYPQTDRHPVTFVSWEDAQEYVSWLSRRTGATYRLPTEAEWERAAAGTPVGVGCGNRVFDEGACPVGSYGVNAAGLSDMVGNLWEWMSDCWEGNCTRRVIRGDSWFFDPVFRRPDTRGSLPAGVRGGGGFRVSRALD